MRLDHFQSQFKSLMLDHPDALNNLDQAFTSQFDQNRIPINKRLSVYRNNIVASLTDVVIATFPIIKNLVGEDFLKGCARTFILKNPPTQGCLNMYGNGFDNFLRDFEPAQQLPYLPDVAMMEIAMNAAYYAPDQIALSAADLQNIAPDDLADTHLHLADHVHLIHSKHPLMAIKSFCENGDEGTLDINQNDPPFMINRPELSIQITPLENDEHDALKNIKNNQTLGQTVEATMAHHPDFDFQAFLQKHLTLKTFIKKD